MLTDLSPLIDREKAQDLLRRIESKRIDQALPAEMELALVWALGNIGTAEIEPYWFGASSLPDAFSEQLIPGHETVVEIAAISDAALPGDEGMRNASRKISHEANKIRRGASRHLSYFFHEDSKWVARESLRWVKVPRDLLVSDYIRNALREWLYRQDRTDGDAIRLQEGELDVVITWHDRPQSSYNFRSSMPPEIRSLRDNYVHEVLRAKARQLKSPLFKGLRCVILGDVGSTALRRLESRDYTNRVVSGSQIISDFLAMPGARLDVIAVITPIRERRRLDSLEETIEWKLAIFCRPGLEIETSGFDALAAQLPPPRREGYQARQLHEQGVFSPLSRGRHLPMSISWRKGERTQIRISARAFLDTLAGRETPERLMKKLSVNGTNNIFKLHLDRGETISAIRIEEKGPDDDDDWIVVEFQDDASARPLRNPLEAQPDS